MPRAPREKQKPKRNKGRKRKASSVSPVTPLAAFFATYSQFDYDPAVSVSSEFYRLCDTFGWDRDDQARKDARQKYQDALVQQFNRVYGTDVNSLVNWQNLCGVVHVDPIPDNVAACRGAIRQTFVNLVDLVDTNRTGVEVQRFESERRLSEYTKDTGKIFPRENAHAGGLLRHLLRRIDHPRDDPPSRGPKKRGSRRKRASFKGLQV